MPLRNKCEVLFLLLLITGCTISMGTTTSSTAQAARGTHHYVRRGENLFRISQYYYSAEKVAEINRGVDKITQANKITGGAISVGQRLLIPGTTKTQPSYALLPPEQMIRPREDTTSSDTSIEQMVEDDTPPATTRQPETIIREKSFLWPVKEGRIISRFGELGNQGIDILIPAGTEVTASDSGTVVFAGHTSRYQETIIIQHNNEIYTVYGHDMSINVKAGDTVKRGETIGTIKNGTQRIRYIHFEIRTGNTPVNPVNYMKEQNNG